ncbi:MAG: trigger factor, partial [Ruthenibacterium sp.]
MNLVKSEKLENNNHELQFSIGAEAFNEAIAKAFKREAGKYNIPGFRKGKAPRHTIEKMYGADVFHYDAINDLFPEAYEAAVAEAKIEPVDRPEVDIVSASTDDGVVLKATVVVKPEVKLGQYKGLKATKTVNTVEEAAVDAEIERMRDRNARMITREGNAENGDITDIDFDGSVDGVAFEGGKGEHFSLTLGSGQFIPGFEEQVVGHAAGETFDVNVKFPADYQAADLADKDAVFKVTLNEIKTKELPALDDEFAKDVSEYDTLDAL